MEYFTSTYSKQLHREVNIKRLLEERGLSVTSVYLDSSIFISPLVYEGPRKATLRPQQKGRGTRVGRPRHRCVSRDQEVEFRFLQAPRNDLGDEILEFCYALAADAPGLDPSRTRVSILK